MLDFLKAPFLVLHFSYYDDNDLPDVICNINIYAGDISVLLSTLSVFSDLICSNNYNWLLNLNLWTGERNGLLISTLEKLSLFRLIGLMV